MNRSTRGIGLIMALTLFLTLFSGTLAYGAEISDAEFDYMKELIKYRYVDPLSPEQLKATTPETLFKRLDKHSVYYTPKEFENLLEQLEGAYSGIGAYVQEDQGKIIIAEPIIGTPAEREGLLSGDQVLEADGITMEGKTLDEAVTFIKGPEGTLVTLKIYRHLTGETLMFDILREEIVIRTVHPEIIEGIGYIKITSFYEHTDEEFFEALTDLYGKGVKGLIIDIRNNGGGLLSSVVAMSQLLVPKGPILHIQYNSTEVSYLSKLTSPLFKDMVVLVNENSASASEILTAALKDSKAATVIGTNTYGKGSVQSIYGLPNGAGFKLTEARYLSPEKNMIDGIGVKPDHEVERFSRELDLENLLPLSLEADIPYGSVGKEVQALQQRFTILGYPIEDKKGQFDQGTLKALMIYAKEREIPLKGGHATLELQRELQRDFVDRVLGREYDMQLNYALDYLLGRSQTMAN